MRNYELVFTPEGIYKISINKNILDVIYPEKITNDTDHDLKYMTSYALPMCIGYDEYRTCDTWDEYMDNIESKLHIANVLFAKPIFNSEDTYCQDFSQYYPEINTIDDYIALVKKIGFDIDFKTWDDDLTMDFGMNRLQYDYVHMIMEKRKNKEDILSGFINHSLLPNTEPNNEINNGAYFDLGKQDLDKLFETIQRYKHGERIII